MSNFYISDMHFGHKNCIAFDNRPFTSVEEMDAAMIANWNNAVSSGDTVYILGDMCWGKQSRAIEILQQFPNDQPTNYSNLRFLHHMFPNLYI